MANQTIYFTCSGTVAGGDLQMIGYDPVCDVILCADNDGGADDVHTDYGGGYTTKPCSSTRYNICRGGSPGSYYYYAIVPDDCCSGHCCCNYSSVKIKADSTGFSSCYSNTDEEDCLYSSWITAINGLEFDISFDNPDCGSNTFWNCTGCKTIEEAFSHPIVPAIKYDIACYCWLTYSQASYSPYRSKVSYNIFMQMAGHSIGANCTNGLWNMDLWQVQGEVDECADLPTNVSGGTPCSDDCYQWSIMEGAVDITWNA